MLWLSKLNTLGDRAFAVAAPRLWNQLPPNIRDAPSIYALKSRLKTHLYNHKSIWLTYRYLLF